VAPGTGATDLWVDSNRFVFSSFHPEEFLSMKSDAGTKTPHRLSLARNKRLWGLVLISPWIIGFVLFKLLPILAALVISFTNYFFIEPEKIGFVGLKNYINLFQDPNVGSGFLGTIKLALIVIPLQTAAAILLASLLSNRTLRMRDTLRVLFFLPSIIPSISTMYMWQGFLDPQAGWINPLLLNPLGLSIITSTPNSTLFILATFWSFGPGFLIMMGAMQGIPEDIYEAVLVDGAGRLFYDSPQLDGRLRWRDPARPRQLVQPRLFVDRLLPPLPHVRPDENGTGRQPVVDPLPFNAGPRCDSGRDVQVLGLLPG
jgi:ABC-type spermidine/putrescine transport system permease subunit II